MKCSITLLVFAPIACFCAPAPITNGSDVADPSSGPLPGFSTSYNDYQGKAAPFPGNTSAPVPPTAAGPPGDDDLLFQNLLAAEWIIYSFYQAGVERFDSQDFVKAGFPNTTYANINRIRDNEAGHLRIFQDSISPTSLKPGPCQYQYPFNTPVEFLATQFIIEIGSQAFLTGLIREARLNASKSALVAVSNVETRHNSWALIEAWNADPFVGPADTVYPYAEHVLETTKAFVKSCPSENPPYPIPDQKLPQMSWNTSVSDGKPGSEIQFLFDTTPAFPSGKEVYAVFFHGVQNVTVPFDTNTMKTIVPQFDDLGLIIATIADTPGAPTAESVLAGPLLLVDQPSPLLNATGYA